MKKPILFTTITFSISWTLWLLAILAQEDILPEIFGIFGMFSVFGPFIAFLLLIKKEKPLKETFKNMFTNTTVPIYLFVTITPFILSGISYLVYRLFETAPEPIDFQIIPFIVTAIIILFVGGPIEEFGWRGYLLPKLRVKYSFVATALIVGLIHGIWHLPLHFLEGTVQSAIPIPEFIAITILTAFAYSFIYEHTKSIIPMIILHLTANLSGALFPYFHNMQGRYTLFTLYLLLDIVLIYLYQRRKINVLN